MNMFEVHLRKNRLGTARYSASSSESKHSSASSFDSSSSPWSSSSELKLLLLPCVAIFAASAADALDGGSFDRFALFLPRPATLFPLFPLFRPPLLLFDFSFMRFLLKDSAFVARLVKYTVEFRSTIS